MEERVETVGVKGRTNGNKGWAHRKKGTSQVPPTPSGNLHPAMAQLGRGIGGE